MRNLICVGEEKAHPPDRVKANGEEIAVKYKDKNKWHSATEQNTKQISTFRGYLGHYALSAYICRFIYLSGVSQRLGNALYPGMDANEAVSKIISTHHIYRKGIIYEFSSAEETKFISIAGLPIFKRDLPIRTRQDKNRNAGERLKNNTGDSGSRSWKSPSNSGCWRHWQNYFHVASCK